MSSSRISALHELDVAARLDKLRQLGWLSQADVDLLKQGQQVLRPASADRMVENAIGVFGLPLAIAPNFIVDGREFIVPMVVEEPSVVAAVSNAARLARPQGFTTHIDDFLIAGQIHISGIADVAAAQDALAASKQELLGAANAVHPRLSSYGGGVRDIEFRNLDTGANTVIAVHVLVDTGDAMGANIVNTICEALAPKIAAISAGDVALRILTNLSDHSMVKARVCYELDSLATARLSAEAVRDQIITASEIAVADPYRATTHNKGIMNGVDAVAIATGNDWRAIEAGAHAYAASSGRYQPLSVWSAGEDGALQGELSMPLRVATIGGTLQQNRAAELSLRLAGTSTSRELAALMAAVGLAQNFAAIKALATEGIQKGHMRMHARATAVENASVKLHDEPDGIAAGKVILLGEHAAVYGKHALALPIPGAVSAQIVGQPGKRCEYTETLLKVIGENLGLDEQDFGAEVRSTLPAGMGLGASAAYAVALSRAVSGHLGLGLDDDSINKIAFECEKLAHGQPSGIDNSIATFAKPMLFRNDEELDIEQIELADYPPVVIALSSQRGATHEQVAAVRDRFGRQKEHYQAIFADIDALAIAGAKALRNADYFELGALMNICHGLLNALEVSTPELESMVKIARSAGAAGAKLTGSGGGGSIVAICPGATTEVVKAFAAAGYQTLSLAANESNQ